MLDSGNKWHLGGIEPLLPVKTFEQVNLCFNTYSTLPLTLH